MSHQWPHCFWIENKREEGFEQRVWPVSFWLLHRVMNFGFVFPGWSWYFLEIGAWEAADLAQIACCHGDKGARRWAAFQSDIRDNSENEKVCEDVQCMLVFYTWLFSGWMFGGRSLNNRKNSWKIRPWISCPVVFEHKNTNVLC